MTTVARPTDSSNDWHMMSDERRREVEEIRHRASLYFEENTPPWELERLRKIKLALDAEAEAEEARARQQSKEAEDAAEEKNEDDLLSDKPEAIRHRAASYFEESSIPPWERTHKSREGAPALERVDDDGENGDDSDDFKVVVDVQPTLSPAPEPTVFSIMLAPNEPEAIRRRAASYFEEENMPPWEVARLEKERKAKELAAFAAIVNGGSTASTSSNSSASTSSSSSNSSSTTTSSVQAVDDAESIRLRAAAYFDEANIPPWEQKQPRPNGHRGGGDDIDDIDEDDGDVELAAAIAQSALDANRNHSNHSNPSNHSNHTNHSTRSSQSNQSPPSSTSTSR